ncbi:MAG TPA: CheR family methyltransferase, partial [Rubellimicrobium sp.]|nr:CheR family methyltransferase [Rubellimicrobium sp.]
MVVLQHREALDEERFRRALAEAGHELVELADGAPVESGRVYLPAAAVIVTVEDGHFAAHPTEQVPGSRAVIDSFLVSLSQAWGERAIVVTLDGIDGNGTLGVREVKGASGLVLAEVTPESEAGTLASSDEPAALADAVLPVEEIAPRLLALIEQVQGAPDSKGPAPDSPETREALATIAGILRTRLGHDFHGYKRGTFLRRVRRRMQALTLDDLPAYIEALRASPSEAQDLFNDLLIGVTEFFRDKKEWELLEREVIPKLFEGKGPRDQIRVWVVGCSTGEEAYSLAILMAEQIAKLEDAPQVQIFASDLDGRALAGARGGRYPESISAHLSPERLGRWFVKEGDTYRVTKTLRDMCVFSQHSIIKDTPFSRIDLISCRNLLIYLDTDLQSRVIPLFHFALRPGGVLFLGNSENVSGHKDHFTPVSPRSRIFQRVETSTPTIPNFPFTSVDRRLLSHSGQTPSREGSQLDLEDFTRRAERITERHVPANVLIDPDHNVLHFSDRTVPFINPTRGAASLNLLQLVHPDLRIDLRAALSRAAEIGRTVQLSGLSMRLNDQRLAVDVVIEPVREADGRFSGYVVIFKDGAVVPSDAALPPSQERAEHDRRLEDELQTTKARLQATIEELETTNEELKSSNEEYQSLNEELQSLNEELETSKEELQSMNEELTTVNGELAHRVHELGHANSDLKNFLESTQIATLFLDHELRVTNFTPASVELFYLIASDLGRPIAHLRSRIAYDELQDDARRVLRTLAPIEKEVHDPATGAHYMVRVLPYRTTDNYIAGVVLTFVDISARRQAEEKQRRSEAHFRAFVTASSDVVYQMGPDWSEMRELDGRGFMVDTLAPSRTWMEGYIHPDDQAEVQSAIGQAISSKALFELEHRVRRPDGTFGWAQSRAVPILDEQGQITQWLGTAKNVTARREAEAALRASEERFRAIVETATNYAIFTTNPEGRIEIWPRGAEAVFGWTAEEAAGQLMDMTYTPEDREAGVPEWERQEAREAGQAPNVRWHVRKDGTRVFIDGVARPLIGPDGALRGYLKVGQDVTERRATEDALRASEARFREFGDASADVLWIRDAESLAFDYVSPAAAEVYGIPAEDLLDGNHMLGWTGLIVPEDRELALDHIRRVRGGEHVLSAFRILRRSDGQVRWIRDTGFPLRDEDGHVRRIGGIGHDATEEIELQDRLKVLVAELQHRTRNLMGVVRSVTDKTLASSTSLPDFQGRIRDRLNALARVNSLLSRLDGGNRITFGELILTELMAHGVVDPDDPNSQVRLGGPVGARLRSSTVQTLALGLHELATNALKYGALSRPEGRLAVTWDLLDGP